MRYLVLLFLAFILISLFSALFFVFKDKGQSRRAVKALTMRVGLSVFLFLMLMAAYHFGLISDHL
ncbi:MAG: twin transmembrane helix small protein [Rhodocyclaceae bacterium]|nr:twin transmembrane helix small protein [Rhodocyclaceae bacterium]